MKWLRKKSQIRLETMIKADAQLANDKTRNYTFIKQLVYLSQVLMMLDGLAWLVTCSMIAGILWFIGCDIEMRIYKNDSQQ